MDYYHDLMTGNVMDEGIFTGITAQAWQSGSIFQHHGQILAVFYYSDTLTEYEQTGLVTWDSVSEQLQIGGGSFAVSHLYTSITANSGLTITGRIYIPTENIGPYDSISLVIRDENYGFWGLLAYGTDLIEKDHISLLHNDIWGELFPFNLSSGWYTVKLSHEKISSQIHLKVWADGENEPGWQIT